MTIEEMKRCKQEKGYTYVQMAELSGIPLGTIQKIFSGETASPRYDTLQALEQIFSRPAGVEEEAAYSADRQGTYTIEDYRALPEEKRVELIDGVFYDMAAPTVLHQRITGEIHRQISNFIMERNGPCQVLIAPVDVQLDCDERTMIQPDVAILCEHERIEKWGIYGSPDFVLEVLSPSTRRKDCIKKLEKYMDAGVREYWILDPYQKKLLVYYFAGDTYPVIYGMEQPVSVNIYEGQLFIDFKHIAAWIDEDAR